MTTQRSAIAGSLPGRIFFPGRSGSLSSQIVSDVRDALFAKKLKPGDFLGTENDLAARYERRRIVARDALRTLEALGIVEIKMGKGGGARIARGNARLFAEALAVQLDLTGVGAAEIMEAQRAIECLAAELAAENATEADIARAARADRRGRAPRSTTPQRFTQLGARIPSRGGRGLAQPRAGGAADLAAARVVAAQQSDADAKVARRVNDVHRELLSLIEMRDPTGARRLMDDHVKMIRARRVAEAKSRPRGGNAASERPRPVMAEHVPAIRRGIDAALGSPGLATRRSPA